MEASNQPITTEELLAEMAWLRGLARRMASEVEVAEDAVQETFLAAMRRGPRQRGNLRGWLSSVLRNAVRRRVRSENRHEARVETWARNERDRDTAPLDVSQRFALEHDLSRAVKALDEDLRRLVLLRFLEGMTLREVSEREGLPISTTDARLTRALGILRAKLENSYGTQEDGRSRFAALLGLYVRDLNSDGLPADVTVAPKPIAWPIAKLAAVALVVAALYPAVVPSDSDGAPELASHGDFERRPTHGATDGLRDARSPAAPPTDGRAPLPAATVATGSIELSFVDSEGLAVPNFPVTLWPRESASPLPSPSKSDQSGQATFAGLRPGWYTVMTDRLTHRQVLIESNTRHRTRFTLPDQTLTGVVVDASGSPVADASVWVLASPGGAYSRGAWVRGVIESPSSIRTDAEGRFEIPHCEHVRLIGARAPGHAPARPLRVVRNEPSGRPPRLELQELQLELPELRLELPDQGRALSGLVVDAKESPLSGAIVFVDGYGDSSPVWPLFATRCDEAGRFTLEGMAVGLHPVTVHAPGFSAWRGEVRVGPSRSAQLIARLDRGASLRGVVRDPSGLPVVDAVVTCQSLDRNSEPVCLPAVETRSDLAGEYALHGLDAGRKRLVVEAKGVGRLRREETFAPGVDRQIDLTLQAARRIDGVLLDPRGAPLPGLTVMSHIRAPYETERAITDERGYFELSMYATGPLPLVVIESGWRVLERELDGTLQALEFVVPDAARPGARVRGRISATDGQVLLRKIGEPRHRGWKLRPGSDGDFESGPLPAGEYRVTWLGHDCERAVTPSRFRLLQGAVLNLGQLDVQEAGSLRLHIDGSDPQPLNGLIHDQEGRLVKELRWDAADWGHPRRVALAAGQYEVCLWSNAASPGIWTVHVQAGEVTELRATLRPGTPVLITVADPRETNFDTLDLSITNEQGETVLDVPVRPALHELGGGYRLELALLPGTYRLSGSRDGRRVLSSSLKVEGSSETRLRWRLE